MAQGVAPASLYEWWVGTAALASVGWVLASAGSVRPGAVLANASRRNWGCRGAALLGCGAAAAILPLIVRQIGSAGRTLVVVAMSGQILLAASFLLWATRRPATGPAPALSARTLPNLLIVPFLVTSGIVVVAELPDVYPLSRYPMFSDTRPDPYTWERVRFLHVHGSGASIALPNPAAPRVMLRMVRDGDVDGLRDLAAHLQAGHGATRVLVQLEKVRVAPYPEPPGVELISAQEVLTVDPD